MTTLTDFDTLLARRTREANRIVFTLAEDWQQGRTTYGGLVAALATQALRDVTGADWPLRALQASFIGPVSGAMQVDVQLLRQGRHVRQVQATVHCNGEVAAVFLGVFGNARETGVPRLMPVRPPVAHEPETARELPFIPGIAPNFIQHLQPRWAEGDLPYSGGSGWSSRIHVRLRQPEGIDAELLTVLLADMPPSPAVGHFKKPAPASSVSWELELLPIAATVDPLGWWRADTDAISAADGYVNQRTTLWAPDGSLAALGYQVAAVYA